MSLGSRDFLSIQDVGSNSSVSIRWNAFVRTHAGNYCHLYEWRHVLENAYSLTTFYLAVVRDSEWIGVLPLALIPGLVGRSAVSVPYCNYGGLLVAKDSAPVLVRKAALSFRANKGIHRLAVW